MTIFHEFTRLDTLRVLACNKVLLNSINLSICTFRKSFLLDFFIKPHSRQSSTEIRIIFMAIISFLYIQIRCRLWDLRLSLDIILVQVFSWHIFTFPTFRSLGEIVLNLIDASWYFNFLTFKFLMLIDRVIYMYLIVFIQWIVSKHTTCSIIHILHPWLRCDYILERVLTLIQHIFYFQICQTFSFDKVLL